MIQTKKKSGPKTRATKKGIKGKPMTVNEAKQTLMALSALAVRASIAQRLGKSFGDERDIYTALGYTKQPTYNDYVAKYKRQDVSRAAINKPVSASWGEQPRITESVEKETEFEKAWVSLVKEKRIFHFLSRLDRLASIGSYAVLLMGFDDGNSLEKEVSSAKKLLYLMPYAQDNAKISTYENDPKNERYGLPKEYTINMKSTGETKISTSSRKVHWSRVIHVAEDLLENNVEGMPRLQSVFNRLQDLDLIAGGSAEMFWRGAFPGLGFKAEEGRTIQGQDLTDLQDEIEEYMHGLKRYLRLRGIDIKELKPQVADPSNHVAIQIDLIACALDIPKRILLGSERGELASSQDERAWLKSIDGRRQDYCELVILRPLIDRLTGVGVLPEPKDGYTVVWPDLLVVSDKEAAEVGAARSKALKDYVEAIGAQDILPPDVFLRKMLGLTQEEISQVELILKVSQQGSGEE